MLYSFITALKTASSMNLNLVEVFQPSGDFNMYSLACQHMVLLITQGSVMSELVPGPSTVALQLHYSFENSFKYEFESGGGIVLL